MANQVLTSSQLFTSELFHLRRGCALYIPEPNAELPSEYLENGVQIGDVGIVDLEGSFDFLFSVLQPADSPINHLGVPDNFEVLGWNSSIRRTEDVFSPGQPILSGGAEKRLIEVGASAFLPGSPIGAGAGFSIQFSRNRGAIIMPPNGVTGFNCRSVGVFREYAEKHAMNWYRWVNEHLGMEAENGSLYFITGVDKTDCWENAVFSSDSKERMCELTVATEAFVGAGFSTRFKLDKSSSYHTFSSRRSPPKNTKQNQALFIRGFRVSVVEKSRSFRKRMAVEVTDLKSLSSWEHRSGSGSGSTFPFAPKRPSSSSSSSSWTSGWRPRSNAAWASLDARLDMDSSTPVFAFNLPEEGYLEEGAVDQDDSSVQQSDAESVSLHSSQGFGTLRHPLQTINEHILRSRDDIEVLVTHDDDWISLLDDEDIEMPNDATLINRLKLRMEVFINRGTAHLQKQNHRPHTSRAKLEAGETRAARQVYTQSPTWRRPCSAPSSDRQVISRGHGTTRYMENSLANGFTTYVK